MEFVCVVVVATATFLLSSPILRHIASKYAKTPVDILLMQSQLIEVGKSIDGTLLDDVMAYNYCCDYYTGCEYYKDCE